MLEQVRADKLDDFFLDLGKRNRKGSYFYRFSGYSPEIHSFICKYYEAARKCGVIIEGRLPNPDIKNLEYYHEMMGDAFQLSFGFMKASLRKWLPNMSVTQNENVAGAVYDTLMNLQKQGKNENMLKNAYVKFMCWLYYKFQRIMHQLGNDHLPKILYEGDIGSYELLLMKVLSTAGCDIILLQYQGDVAYQKLDPGNAFSQKWEEAGTVKFPANFSLAEIRKEIEEKFNNQRLYGTPAKLLNCTNAWISGKIMEDLQLDAASRGQDQNLFYNCFFRVAGVEDRLTYENELYQLQLTLKNAKRAVVIVDAPMEVPTMDEIGAIRRNRYQNIQQLIMDLSTNLSFGTNQEMQRIATRAFVDLLLEEGKKDTANLNRLTNKAVYLLCWMKRYLQSQLSNWKPGTIPCFFYMGGCRNDNEVLFLRFLARLPVDVVIWSPNLNQRCTLTDSLLYEAAYTDSLNVEHYPQNNAEVRVGTTAYHAERDLDTLMYQDTGIYRNQQYAKAAAITLQTMYEEIPILWNQELKYRPNFSTVEGLVNMPVIYSKICGVKDGLLPAYWSGIKELMTEDAILVQQVPQITSTSPNPMKACATEFLKNGRLLKSKIKAHKAYPYGLLREPMQDFLLEKLQLLIDQKLIRGTFENGTEYTIVATALNLDKSILRLIQKFDFTKKNPKLIYVITGETAMSLEDTICSTFLNLVGFDVLFFVPTGYQCIEKYLNRQTMEEHQIGQYLYDLQVPNFANIQVSTARSSWREILFKRGT